MSSFVRAARSRSRQVPGGCCAGGGGAVGDVTLLWRAAERLGIGLEVAETGRAQAWSRSARACGSAIRSSARPSTGRVRAERREVHRALADATTRGWTRIAGWHRARAAEGPTRP